MVRSNLSGIGEAETDFLALSHKALNAVCKNREELFCAHFLFRPRHTHLLEI